MTASSEIKISVNGGKNKNQDQPINNSVSSARKNRVKAAKKKNINSKTLERKTVSPTKPTKSASASTNKKASGLARLITTAIITTLVVGGAIYIWQQSLNKKTVDRLSGEARDAKISFEERIDNLKRKLTGTESEKAELEKRAQELEARMAILNKAKIDYKNDELGISFTYPAVFGDIELDTKTVASGTIITGQFLENAKLIFGGVNEEYELSGTSTIPEVTELQGFTERRRDYFLLGPSGKEYGVNPVEVIETEAGDALLIDSRSFVLDNEDAEPPVNIGQNAVIVINLENEDFTGLSFMNSDFGILPLESFIGMIETIEIMK